MVAPQNFHASLALVVHVSLDHSDRYVQPWLVSEQKQVDITSLWGKDDTMMLVAARSMG